MTAVAKSGGISREDVGGDLDEVIVYRLQRHYHRRARRMTRIYKTAANGPCTICPTVRAHGGMSVDGMAEYLSQFGYPVTTRNELLDAMHDGIHSHHWLPSEDDL